MGGSAPRSGGGGGGAKRAAPCAPTAADAAALRAKCEVGASFAMLLQLKGFLKDVYQLSDKKCGEYAPADTSRTTEKAIAPGLKVPEFALGAATRALVDASAGGAAPPLEAQRDLFVELRALMHDDAAGLLTTGLAPERKGAKGTSSKSVTMCKSSSRIVLARSAR